MPCARISALWCTPSVHLRGSFELSISAATIRASLAAPQSDGGPARWPRAQALQCLVNILRALVEWYIRAVPALDARDAPGGPAGEEAPRTDWQPLTSKQSQDLEALAARAARLKGAAPAPGPEGAPGPPAEEERAAGDGDGDAAGAGAADGGPPAPPDAVDASGAASGVLASRAVLRQHALPAQQPCDQSDRLVRLAHPCRTTPLLPSAPRWTTARCCAAERRPAACSGAERAPGGRRQVHGWQAPAQFCVVRPRRERAGERPARAAARDDARRAEQHAGGEDPCSGWLSCPLCREQGCHKWEQKVDSQWASTVNASSPCCALLIAPHAMPRSMG